MTRGTFYAAGVSYEQRFNLGDVPTWRFVFACRTGAGAWPRCWLTVNPPVYRVSALAARRYGPILERRKQLEVIVIGTLKNTLGPHHGKPSLGTAWPGMFQKAPASCPPGAEYDTVGYGLAQPFELKQIVQQ